KQGYSITIFDKGVPGKGTTSAAAGMLAPINELELTELDLLNAGIHSQKLYQEWKLSLGDIGWIPEGTLEVAQSRDDLPGLERLFDYQTKAGLEVYWRVLAYSSGASIPGTFDFYRGARCNICPK
ncbi:MAG: FAD-dependent oxidoreductase, partial [Sphingobacteriia bacterium]|nr:FAD-dependent oxidoreductase [Sphingobacteriia bacterium]